ncbi:MAG: hypothetical protein C0468_06810 [Planctomyces sp.]|nr:hypothetical protein [Planctomyces sp.]
MDAAWLAMLGVVGVGSLVGGVYWSAVLREVVLSMRQLPTARDGLAAAQRHEAKAHGHAGAWPTVCVIVPAYNEERVIATLARSLVRQDYPAGRLSLVFALDRCTDATAERIAQATAGSGVEVQTLRITRCAQGWSGKVHAVWHAVNHAQPARQADLLLFVDADTELEPQCLRATVALLLENDLAMVSLGSTLARRFWFERLVQPVTSYELLRQFPPRKVNRRGGRGRRAVANGQYMLFRREAYQAVGGHAAVREALLEDLMLAKALRQYGLALGFYLAAGLLHCRMYDGFAAFVSGWKRIYQELSHRRPRRLKRFSLALLLTDLAMPGAMVGAVGLGALAWAQGGASAAQAWAAAAVAGVGAVAYAVYLGALVTGCVWGRTPAWNALSQPVGAAITAWILWCAAVDLESGVETRWGGRTYKREPRFEGDHWPWQAYGTVPGWYRRRVQEAARAAPDAGDAQAAPAAEATSPARA